MALILTGNVQTPGGTALAPGSQPASLAVGPSAELIVSDLHGAWYEIAKAGFVFMAAVTAAATLPVNAATLASVFCIINPTGSGKNLELIDADFASVNATEVVNAIQLVYQTTPGGVTGLSSLTAGTIHSGIIGATANSVATFYTAATHTGTPTVYQTLWDVTATAAGISNTHYNFNGSLIVPPGTIIDLATSTGALTNWVGNVRWAEWPI